MAAPQGVLLCASAKICPGTFSQSNVCSGEGTRPTLLVSFDCDSLSEEGGGKYRSTRKIKMEKEVTSALHKQQLSRRLRNALSTFNRADIAWRCLMNCPGLQTSCSSSSEGRHSLSTTCPFISSVSTFHLSPQLL